MADLNKAIQQSFVEGLQISLAEMNEEEYRCTDTYSGRLIEYGQTFFIFRGRIFDSHSSWQNWLLENAEVQFLPISLAEDADAYKKVWDKYKKDIRKSHRNC